MSTLGSILILLVILSILVVVHEWGHYIVARLFKVQIREFSVFVGPAIIKRISKKTGITYALRTIPMGGYCAFEAVSEDENEIEPQGEIISSKPWYIRMAISLAGPLMNLIVALVFITIVNMFAGFSTNQVSVVSDNLPMAVAGLEVGDRITGYQGLPISTPTDYDVYTFLGDELNVYFTVKKANGTEWDYIIKRKIDINNPEDDALLHEMSADVDLYRRLAGEKGDGEYVGNYISYWSAVPGSVNETQSSLYIKFTWAEGSVKEYTYTVENGEIGTLKVVNTSSDGTKTEYLDENITSDEVKSIVYTYDPYKFGFSYTYMDQGGFFECVSNGCLYLASLVRSVAYSVAWLVTGQLGFDALTGPIGMTNIVNDVVVYDAAVSLKILTLMDFLAVISANLFVMNLIPIPGLDGGRILLIIIEVIRGGRKIPQEKEAIITFIFMILILLLGLAVAFKDIGNIIG